MKKLILRFQPGGNTSEIINVLLDNLSKLGQKKDVIRKMSDHYTDLSKSKSLNANWKIAAENYELAFKETFDDLRKLLSADGIVGDGIVFSKNLSPSQILRLRDLYALDPRTLTSSELAELRELSRLNKGLKENVNLDYEVWPSFRELTLQPIDKTKRIVLDPYDYEGLPIFYEAHNPSLNASRLTLNASYPDWRLDPNVPVDDKLLTSLQVNVPKASELKANALEELRKNGHIGEKKANMDGFYAEKNRWGIWEVKRLRKDSKNVSIKPGYVHGTDPNAHTTAKGREEANRLNPKTGLTTRGRGLGSKNGTGSITYKWVYAEAHNQIPDEYLKQVKKLAINGASAYEVEQLRAKILRELGLL